MRGSRIQREEAEDGANRDVTGRDTIRESQQNNRKDDCMQVGLRAGRDGEYKQHV